MLRPRLSRRYSQSLGAEFTPHRHQSLLLSRHRLRKPGISESGILACGAVKGLLRRANCLTSGGTIAGFDEKRFGRCSTVRAKRS